MVRHGMLGNAAGNVEKPGQLPWKKTNAVSEKNMQSRPVAHCVADNVI